MVAAQMRDKDVHEACSGVVEIYRHFYMLSPDNGRFYAFLMAEWSNYMTTHLAGRMEAAQRQRSTGAVAPS